MRPDEIGPICGGCYYDPEITIGSFCNPTILFAGGYTLLGLITIIVALILLRGKEAHQAVAMVCLYVCVILTGGRIWQTWFAIKTSPPWFNDGINWINWESFREFKSASLMLAWPFIAMAGHCFIMATGSLVRCATSLRNRIAVTLCGVTLCVGLLCPLYLLHTWRDWMTNTLPQIADACNETRRLTDEMTIRLIQAQPTDWRMLLLRADYLNDVGRIKEAQSVDLELLRLIPPEMETLRERIIQGKTATQNAPIQ